MKNGCKITAEKIRGDITRNEYRSSILTLGRRIPEAVSSAFILTCDR